MTTPILMLLIVTASLTALAHGVCIIARMSRATRFSIRLSFVAQTTGLAATCAAVLDYIAGDPFTWPWLMLLGVSLTNAGTAGLYVFNRRACACPGCPSRPRVVHYRPEPR